MCFENTLVAKSARAFRSNKTSCNWLKTVRKTKLSWRKQAFLKLKNDSKKPWETELVSVLVKAQELHSQGISNQGQRLLLSFVQRALDLSGPTKGKLLNTASSYCSAWVWDGAQRQQLRRETFKRGLPWKMCWEWRQVWWRKGGKKMYVCMGRRQIKRQKVE